MKKIRLLRKVLLLIAATIFTASFVFAQTKTITGTVSDKSDGDPLIGVTVQVKENPKIGTLTQSDGTFTLQVSDEAQNLIFSYVGFNEVTLPVSDNMTVEMSKGQSLEEIVVVGYGTQKAKDVSTAISSISDDDFNRGVITNPMQQVQGKVSGLVITQPSGDPNENVSIRLRGQASLTGGQAPLVVLDGVPLDDPNIIANIPPEDIASYDVLKDASATAIYGSRGANGVIIINTKKGSAGKTQVTYSGQIGIATLAKNYDMLNAEEWKDAARSVGADQSTIDNTDKGGNTDWMKAITRTAFTHSHNLGISGGSENFTYYGYAS